MNIYNVICTVEDGNSLASFAFPCSDENIAEDVLGELEELYGDLLLASAIVESQLDQGLSKQRAIH